MLEHGETELVLRTIRRLGRQIKAPQGRPRRKLQQVLNLLSDDGICLDASHAMLGFGAKMWVPNRFFGVRRSRRP
jgi:hypothetical protein